MIFGINFSDDLIHISGLPVLISRYKYPNSIQNPKSWKITLTYQALSQTFENMGGGKISRIHISIYPEGDIHYFHSFISTCWTTFVFISMLKSHSHTLSISVLLLLSLLSQVSPSHSLYLDMMNNSCFHVYAQKSLFFSKNCKRVFWTASALPNPVNLEFIELVPS